MITLMQLGGICLRIILPDFCSADCGCQNIFILFDCQDLPAYKSCHTFVQLQKSEYNKQGNHIRTYLLQRRELIHIQHLTEYD